MHAPARLSVARLRPAKRQRTDLSHRSSNAAAPPRDRRAGNIRSTAGNPCATATRARGRGWRPPCRGRSPPRFRDRSTSPGFARIAAIRARRAVAGRRRARIVAKHGADFLAARRGQRKRQLEAKGAPVPSAVPHLLHRRSKNSQANSLEREATTINDAYGPESRLSMAGSRLARARSGWRSCGALGLAHAV